MACYMLQSSINGSFETGPVKIGTSKDVPKRMRAIQASHSAPLRLIRTLDGGIDVEAWLHKRFADLRKSGEWFAFDPDMLTVAPPKSKKTDRKSNRVSAPFFLQGDRIDLVAALERAQSVLTEVGSMWSEVPGEIRRGFLDAAHEIQVTLLRTGKLRWSETRRIPLSLDDTDIPRTV